MSVFSPAVAQTVADAAAQERAASARQGRRTARGGQTAARGDDLVELTVEGPEALSAGRRLSAGGDEEAEQDRREQALDGRPAGADEPVRHVDVEA